MRSAVRILLYPTKFLAPAIARSLLGYWVLAVIVRRSPKARRQLVFGPTPLINNKYWSRALKAAGYDTITLVTHHYAVNKRSDFDVYYDDLVNTQAGGIWRNYAHFRDLAAFFYLVRNARVVHMPFTGGPLGATPFWRHEAALYKLAGIRTVVIPYGGDAHLYSTIVNTSMRNALLIDYPAAARNERNIRERVDYWISHADCIVCGALVYGMSRWDVATPSPLCLDVAAIAPRQEYSMSNGERVPVRVVHTPNHRGFKGTEFIIQAVEELKDEGLNIDLVLLEGVPNDRIIETLNSADVLVEQLIAGSYALSAIEGMANGIAVLSNVEDPSRREIFRRYSFAEECPILSTTPETIKENLRLLVRNPGLRRQLGRAGRQFVEKYHSYETAQYLFESIYAKIVDGKNVDLMNLFHPLKSEFNKRRRRVDHPLKGGFLPAGYVPMAAS
jgi:glycosyltransferase involved in cell wall biosynthesis